MTSHISFEDQLDIQSAEYNSSSLVPNFQFDYVYHIRVFHKITQAHIQIIKVKLQQYLLETDQRISELLWEILSAINYMYMIHSL